MSVKRLEGPNGSYIDVADNDGYYTIAELSPYNQDRYQHWHTDYTARPDDVIICEYPKSGLHWVWEICTMLQRGTANYSAHKMASSHLEIRSVAHLEHLPSPRVLSTHAWPSMLPESVRRARTKIVYVVRDPRAVAVSYFNHLKQMPVSSFHGSWSNFLWHFLYGKVPYGSWFDHTKVWERHIQENRDIVHTMAYEELLTHPLEELRKLARFLGVQPSTQLLQDIQRACSFNNLKAEKDKRDIERLGSELFNKRYTLYRKGSMDSWKDTFTVRQNEQFIEQCAKLMANSKVQLKCLL